MKRWLISTTAILLGIGVQGNVRAEEPKAESLDAAPAVVAPATETRPAPKSKPKTKQRRKSEREAEGTEAHDRFEAETVIKSRYHYRGEPLEVDPD